jgi:hypothetical protein
MTVYIDPPDWPGRGLMWSHLVSDVSYEELHTFAQAIGCPRQAFDRDHYDVPAARYDAAVAAGAVEVGCKELLRRLTAAGLRRPRRRAAAPAGGEVPQTAPPARPDPATAPGAVSAPDAAAAPDAATSPDAAAAPGAVPPPSG